MNLRRLFIAAALMLGFLAAQAQDKMFENFSKNKDITSVFISKSLLSMVPDMGGATKGVNIKELTDKLEKLEVYTSEDKGAIKTMVSEIQSMKKNLSYESLMSVREKSETVDFYVRKDKDGKFRDLIMFVSEPDECTVIRLVGNFSAEDLQGIVGSLK